MAIEKVLIGSVVVIDLAPNGTLRASNVERQYVISDGDVVLARPTERGVLTAETLSSVLPAVADLAIEVQQLESDLSAASTELMVKSQALTEALARIEALQAEKETSETARGAALTETADKQLALDAALAQVAAFQAEKDAAAERSRQSVSPAAARVVLRDAGLLKAVEAAVEAADPHSDLRIFWDWSEVWRRESPFINQLGASLGLNSQQIDALFASAAALS